MDALLKLVLLLGYTAYFASSTPDLTGFQECLKKFRVPSSVIVEGANGTNPRYKSLNVQWQLKPPQVSPLAFVLVRTESDVVSVVRCGLETNVQVVAKGGGHSFEKFSYGDGSKVVVDLRELDDLVVATNKESATVGAGWLTGPLQWRLWEEAKSLLPTTLCPTVGISGSSTGGGHGPFAGQYGLTADNILEMNVVTANGELLCVNAAKNADLYWALRGGGAGSFGIVTRFVFKIYPAPAQVFVGTLTFSAHSFEVVFQAWQEYTVRSVHSIIGEPKLNGDGSMDILLIDATGTDTEFVKAAKRFPPPVEQTKTNFSFPDFLLYQAKEISAEFLQPGTKFDEPKDMGNLRRESSRPIYQIRKSYFVAKEVGLNAIRAFKELLNRKPEAVVAWIEQFGGAVNDLQPNATAFVHRGTTMYNICSSYKTVVPPTKLDPLARTWLAEFLVLGEKYFGGKYTYENYVDIELKGYLRKYFGSNLERLVEVKKKYDPKNYFSNPQSVPTEL